MPVLASVSGQSKRAHRQLAVFVSADVGLALRAFVHITRALVGSEGLSVFGILKCSCQPVGWVERQRNPSSF